MRVRETALEKIAAIANKKETFHEVLARIIKEWELQKAIDSRSTQD